MQEQSYLSSSNRGALGNIRRDGWKHRKRTELDVKRVLILVLSTEKDWYGRLAETSQATWDSVEVEGVETIFYFGRSDKPSTDKILYTTSDDEFHSMGKKTLCAFEHALAHRQFDYVFRGNASLFIDKSGLAKYCLDKPATNLALGVLAPGEHNTLFLWGPSYLLSRDLVQKIVDNKEQWNHATMDDVSISNLLNSLDVPLDNRGSMASIALTGDGYEFVYYENGASGGCAMKDLRQIHEMLPNQFAFRVKDDANRENDVRLMKELREVFR